MGREARKQEAEADWESEGRELEQKQVAALESMAASLEQLNKAVLKGVRILGQINSALKQRG